MARPQYFYAMGPHLHEYLQEMNKEVLSKYDVMTVGEAFGVTLDQTPTLVDERRNELNMIFNFDAVRLNRKGDAWREWKLTELKAIYTKQDQALDVHSWNTVFLSNHDNPRVVSAFGNDSPAYRVASAKALATMLLTLKGTPFIYQGDELGMTNYPFTGIDQFDDIAVKNAWQTFVVSKQVSADHFLAEMRKTSRDNSRTPMQWDGSTNAGFTTASKPWLAVNPNYLEINAKQELSDKGSIYHYFRKMTDVRRNAPAFVYGGLQRCGPWKPAGIRIHALDWQRPLSRGGQLLHRGDYLQCPRRVTSKATRNLEPGTDKRTRRRTVPQRLGGQSLQILVSNFARNR